MSPEQMIMAIEVYIHLRTGETPDIDYRSILSSPEGMHYLMVAYGYAEAWFQKNNVEIKYAN
ncbi:MAG TPA: hypothetical protein VK031_06280 [Tissierellaceae bacterium]|nr:hypothetical protein [Tissierellaceae bacterium]